MSAGQLVAEYSTQIEMVKPQVSYLTTDHLGSPRVLTNKQGEVVSRRDFMPFGEEIAAMAETHRMPGDKYGVGDGVRQKFTGYERDDETGLDFAEARYYYNNHGRFTAVDPLLASGKSADPQTFNRYAYTMNRPLILTDPTGLQAATNPNQTIAMPEHVRASVSRPDEWYKSGFTILFKNPSDNVQYAQAEVTLTENMTSTLSEQGDAFFTRGVNEAALFKAALTELNGLVESLDNQNPVVGASDVRRELNVMIETAEMGKPIIQTSGTSVGLSLPSGVGASGGQQVEGSGAVANYNNYLSETNTAIAVEGARFSRNFDASSVKIEGVRDQRQAPPFETSRLPLTTGTLQRIFTRRMEEARQAGRDYIK